MPLPLVPIAVAGATAAAGALATVLRPKITEMLKTKTVAVLGSPQVGKTTLLQALKAQTPLDPADLADAERVVRFTLLTEGKTGNFAVKNDVPGAPKAKFTQRKEAFDDADAVLYLFRADLVSTGDSAHVQIVKGHLDMLKDWADAAGRRTPQVVLAGTWADQSPMFEADPQQFAERVQTADPIKLGRRKFSRNAPVVVGSLTTDRSEQFIAELASTLVRPAR